MIKAFKYRIYPTQQQELTLDRTLITCRLLYNQMLGQRISKYKREHISLSYVDQANGLIKNDYQKALHSQVCQDTIKRLDQSFRNFFRRVKERKAGKKVKLGFPRFKSRNRFRSFCYPQSGFKIVDNHIQLSKIGNIKLIYSRPTEGRIKTCRVLKDVDQWFVILTCECEDHIKFDNGKPSIGIDVGIKTFAYLSDGTKIDNPRFLQKSSHKLRKEQRRLSRKVKGSKNRNKQRIRTARVHRKIRRQRIDFLHKTSTWLVNNYGTIVFEDLNIKGMLKNHKLAKAISDVSWKRLIVLTQNKAENAGSRVLLVCPKNTSQDCSRCGKKVPKALSERIHCCPHCGLEMDRDENASLNILSRAGIVQTVKSLDSINAYRNDIIYHGSHMCHKMMNLMKDRDMTTTLDFKESGASHV